MTAQLHTQHDRREVHLDGATPLARRPGPAGSPHDQQPHHWFDLLEVAHPDVDDALPAWCDCGHQSLSRDAILDWIGAGKNHVVID